MRARSEAGFFWSEAFGSAEEKPWSEFAPRFEAHVIAQFPFKMASKNLPFERVIRYAFGAKAAAAVRREHLETFLRRFGPLSECVPKAAASLFDLTNGCLRPWFHGELPRKGAEELLRGAGAGTYLFRFSDTRPSNFSLSYVVRATTLRNSLLYNSGRDGFKLDATRPSRTDGGGGGGIGGEESWSTLASFVESHAKCLRHPVVSELYRQCEREIEVAAALAASESVGVTADGVAEEPTDGDEDAVLPPLPQSAGVGATAVAVPRLPPPSATANPSRELRLAVSGSQGAVSGGAAPPEAAPALNWLVQQSKSSPGSLFNGAPDESPVQRLRLARRLYGQAQELAVGDGPAAAAAAAATAGSTGAMATADFAEAATAAAAAADASAQEALALLDRVFAILAEHGAADRQLEAKALRLRGDVAAARGEAATAAASYAACLRTVAIACAEQDADDGGGAAAAAAAVSWPAQPVSFCAVQAHAHRGLALLHLAAGEPEAALRHFAELVACTADQESRRDLLGAWRAKLDFRNAVAGWSESAVEAVLDGGTALFREKDYGAAAAAYRRALVMARCVGADKLEARALGNLCVASRKAGGGLADAIAQYRICLQLLRQLRDGDTEKKILNQLVMCCMEAQRWKQALAFNTQLLPLAGNRDDVNMISRRRDQIFAAAGWNQPATGAAAGGAER